MPPSQLTDVGLKLLSPNCSSPGHFKSHSPAKITPRNRPEIRPITTNAILLTSILHLKHITCRRLCEFDLCQPTASEVAVSIRPVSVFRYGGLGLREQPIQVADAVGEDFHDMHRKKRILLDQAVKSCRVEFGEAGRFTGDDRGPAR